MLLLLLANNDSAAEIGPSVAQELGALGVTSLSVPRDAQTTAVALEGWAFDIDRSADTAARVVVGEAPGIRVLRPVLESSLPANGRPTTQGRTR